MVRVHLQHASDALSVTLDGIQNLRAAVENPGIDAHEGKRADKRVSHDLECKPGERLVVRASAGQLVVAVDLGADDIRHIRGRWEEVDNRVKKRLYPFVLESTAAEHGDKRAADGAFADAAGQRLQI